jgi:hypothetical protein
VPSPLPRFYVPTSHPPHKPQLLGTSNPSPIGPCLSQTRLRQVDFDAVAGFPTSLKTSFMIHLEKGILRIDLFYGSEIGGK